MVSQAFAGWISIFIATLGFGSLFVPVKNYEIYDGLVYQWFQCCGILLAGLTHAVCMNDWNASGLSAPGFYVCREGLLSGVFFQLANVLATQSVKRFGMGNYFTTQKVTNLGGAFVLGVYGDRFGLPCNPPRSPLLALGGCFCVMLGMVPLGFTESEDGKGDDKRPHLIPPQHCDLGGYLMLDETSEMGSALGTPVYPRSEPGSGRATPVIPARSRPSSAAWFQGLAWSLLAGMVFAVIYIPVLPWKQRLSQENVTFSPFDYFLSISVGLFMSSTAYMLLGGAMRKYQGKKMMKSVLRPALLNGIMWSIASMAQLYALAVMPYAVAYCLVCGGEVAVSLLWGIFVFNEAATPHNFRCTMLAFSGVLVGVVLVAASK
ncbi:unnamed protein product [Effrenium voratum]|uniref:Uncharacterized protein n=1 Tax=Effrenium voratum TaxID=2562239 RepID=A0AA36MMR9_9DINO|nr:unnamed protein product [Effrenium voratum]